MCWVLGSILTIGRMQDLNILQTAYDSGQHRLFKAVGPFILLPYL